MSQTNLNVRTDADVKRQAEEILNDLGMNMTTAVNVFLKQVVLTRGIPFHISSDPFYSEANQRHLQRSIEQLESGKATMITKTMDELEAMAADE